MNYIKLADEYILDRDLETADGKKDLNSVVDYLLDLPETEGVESTESFDQGFDAGYIRALQALSRSN